MLINTNEGIAEYCSQFDMNMPFHQVIFFPTHVCVCVCVVCGVCVCGVCVCVRVLRAPCEFLHGIQMKHCKFTGLPILTRTHMAMNFNTQSTFIRTHIKPIEVVLAQVVICVERERALNLDFALPSTRTFLKKKRSRFSTWLCLFLGHPRHLGSLDTLKTSKKTPTSI